MNTLIIRMLHHLKENTADQMNSLYLLNHQQQKVSI